VGREDRELAVHLLAAVDQTLLHGRNALLLLNLLLDLRHLSLTISLYSYS
jgi:hypothetical protein